MAAEALAAAVQAVANSAAVAANTVHTVKQADQVGIPAHLANIEYSLPVTEQPATKIMPVLAQPTSPQPINGTKQEVLRPAGADPTRPAEWALVKFNVPIPKDMDSKQLAYAYVNHSRWVVDCPFCPSAQMTAPEDPRFFCVDCRMVANGGKWVKVVWPSTSTKAAIERTLGLRPKTQNRNWWPEEAVQKLQAENVANGYSPS